MSKFPHLIYDKRDAFNEAVAYFETDCQGVITYASKKFCALCGYTLDELVGNTPRLFSSGQTEASEYALFWETILNGKIWHWDICNRTKQGALFWVHLVVFPITDKQSGAITEFVAVMTDVTPRKKTSENEVTIALDNARVHEHHSQFIREIIHDFNNIFGTLAGYADVATQRLQLTHYTHVADCLMTIKKNLDRGVLLIEKLATYDQQMPEEIPLISPANIIEEVLAVSRVMYTNPRIDFTFVNPLAHPSALIALESTKLYALLKQLIANASGHLTPSSTQTPPLITIELCAPPHQHDVCQRCNATLSGALISLRLEVPTVIDAARLTAKTVMDATQPLTNILDLHCRYGHSRVELMPNCTRVWLYFAVAGHAPTQAQALHLSQPYAPQLKTLAPPTQRRLCVIDDELSICDLLQTELTFLGYAVAVFSESVMALDYINTYAHEIDGAIIDIKMPTISGFDLAQALLTKRPQLPVIFLTGYTRQREIETHLPQGNVFLFQKPHIAADEIHRTLIRFFKDDF